MPSARNLGIGHCDFRPHGKSQDGRSVYRCVKCGTSTPHPTRRPPHRQCRIIGKTHARQAPCRHLNGPIRELPAGWCGCGSPVIRLYDCQLHAKLVAQSPYSKSTARELRSVESEWDGSTCANCEDRNPLPLWCIHGQTLPPDTDTGIVTGASARHWPCVGALAIAAVQQRLGLAVADHGLEDWQRDELHAINVRWIAHDKPEIEHIRRHQWAKNAVEAWWKPWICLASPFERSVWIDSDAVVTGDTSPIFSEPSPRVATQRRWQSDGRKLYRKLLDNIRTTPVSEDVFLRASLINSGVFSWRRDEPLLREWVKWSRVIMADGRLANITRVRDQSALFMAVLIRLLDGKPVHFLDDDWNTPADNLPSGESTNRLPIELSPCEFLATAISRHPGAKIVHWLGGVKPWRILSKTGLHRT